MRPISSHAAGALIATCLATAPRAAPAGADSSTGRDKSVDTWTGGTGPPPDRTDEARAVARAATSHRWMISADAIGRINPAGIHVLGGVYYREVFEWDERYGVDGEYLQGGLQLGANPGYTQGSAMVDYAPAAYARTRVAYDLYGFYGINGSLLSYDDSDSDFGAQTMAERSGEERAATAHRLSMKQLLQAKVSCLIMRNETDLGWYHFDGEGPYFHEWEHDTLLRSGDWLLANRAQLFFQLWHDGEDAALLLGPQYEVDHAFSTGITRQRIGSQSVWIPASRMWGLDRPRLHVNIGMNIQDRNRAMQSYAVFGLGSDFDISG